MQRPRLYDPDADAEPADETMADDPAQVLGLVHQLEEQAARATSSEVRTQLLRAGCELLDAAMKELKLPKAA